MAFGRFGSMGRGFGRGNAKGNAAPALSPYLGQVATRCYEPDAFNTTNKQMRGRSAHVAMDAITQLTLIFPNYYVDGFGAGATYAELGVGAASNITASIEYPAGTFTQVLFSGVATGIIPNASTLLTTVNINIAKGDWYFVRYFITNTAGIVFCLGFAGTNTPGNFALGDVLDAAASGLTDNTMGGAYTATSGTSRYSPTVMAASTLFPSFYINGNSKGYGENDQGDGSGDVGEVQRWISPYFANASFCIRGRDAAQFNANSTIQVAMAQYFTHLISEDGVNCLIHGQSAATTATNTTALAAKFPGLKKYITTILPAASTTDNYATLGNQTPGAGVFVEADRATENQRRRPIPTGYDGVFDSASAVESAQDSGKIAVLNGTTSRSYFNTSSAVHPLRQGYVAVREKNRPAAKLLSRNGVPLTFANQVFIDQMDTGTDETDAATYGFATPKPNGFLIGPASAFRIVFFSTVARLGTTGATTVSATANGSIGCTKVAEISNTTGGAQTLQTLWSAPVPTGDTCTFSVVYSTTMLRCGVDVWTAVGDSALPTVGTSQTNAGAAAVATLAALTVPARGGALVFANTVNGSLPTMAATNFAQVLTPVQIGTGTLYMASGSIEQAGSKAFSATFSAGTVTTAIGVVVSP